MENVDKTIGIIKRVGNFCSNLLLGDTKEIIIRTDERVSNLNEKMGNLNKTLDNVKHNVQAVSNFLINNPEMDFDGSLIKTYSPAQLTELGEKYLENIKFVEVFNSNKNDFFESIDVENPKTKYDVENASIKSVHILFHKEYFEPIKKFLYNKPTEKFQTIAHIAGIHIRDKYLEKHPEIKE